MPIQRDEEVIFEGQPYLVFRDFHQFRQQICRQRRAVLLTDSTRFTGQFNDLFALVTNCFGLNSPEAYALQECRLYCGGCGVAYRNSILGALIQPTIVSRGLPRCPKCKSEKLSLLCCL